MYTEERIANCSIIVRLWFILNTVYSFYKLYLFLINLKASAESTVDVKRSNASISKRKKEVKKVNKLPSEAALPTKSPVQKKRNKGKRWQKPNTYSILCQYKCDDIVNIGYVSVNCTEKCYNQYHSQCWAKFLKIQHVEGETALLGQDCLTQLCSGKIFEIVWVTKCGIETSRKYVYADLNTVQQSSKQRGKGKQKEKLTRSLSDSSGASGSSDKKSYDEKGVSKVSTSSHSKLQQSKSLDVRNFERPETPKQDAMPLRTLPLSYAGMVKNNNSIDSLESREKNKTVTNINNSEILEEILELNCPEILNQNCKLPEKSKILSLIAKSKEPDVYRRDHATSSSALVFVPGDAACAASVARAASEARPLDREITPTFEKEKQAAPVARRSPSDRKKVGPSPNFEASQFTKIMAKHFFDYKIWEVDRAIKEVSSKIKLEELTIPIFKRMIQDKLDEADENEIFMSDEEDVLEDECPICTELLRDELHTLVSCSHVFHDACIKKWLKKDLTCPKCRAIVEKNE